MSKQRSLFDAPVPTKAPAKAPIGEIILADPRNRSGVMLDFALRNLHKAGRHVHLVAECPLCREQQAP